MQKLRPHKNAPTAQNPTFLKGLTAPKRSDHSKCKSSDRTKKLRHQKIQHLKTDHTHQKGPTTQNAKAPTAQQPSDRTKSNISERSDRPKKVRPLKMQKLRPHKKAPTQNQTFLKDLTVPKRSNHSKCKSCFRTKILLPHKIQHF